MDEINWYYRIRKYTQHKEGKLSLRKKIAPLVRVKKRNRVYSALQKPSSALGDKTYFNLIGIHSLKAAEDKYEPVLIERCPVD